VIPARFWAPHDFAPWFDGKSHRTEPAWASSGKALSRKRRAAGASLQPAAQPSRLNKGIQGDT
jgi:hypothetical protein